MTTFHKTYKVIIFSVLLITFYGISSLPTFAKTINITEVKADYEIFEMEEDFMDEFKDLGECLDAKIKIYSQDNRLVRCGSEKSDMIKNLIQRADFLADVSGTEIYRLNK